MWKIATDCPNRASKNSMSALVTGTLRLPRGVLLLLPAALVLVGPSRASDATGVRFSGMGFRVGDSRIVESRSLADEKFTIFSKGKALVKEHNIDDGRGRRVESVLRQEAGIAVSVKVVVQKDAETKRSNSKSRSIKRVTHGRTYIISRVGDKLAIRYPDGKTPGPNELRILSRQYRDLGRMSVGSALLLGRRIKPGERADFLAPVIKRYFGAKKSTRYENTKIVFSGVREKDGAKCGVFKFKTTVVLPVGKTASVIVYMDGEMLYRLRGAWPVAFEMRGPITIKSKGGSTGMRGEGRAELIYKYTYKKKPKAAPKRRTIGG